MEEDLVQREIDEVKMEIRQLNIKLCQLYANNNRLYSGDKFIPSFDTALEEPYVLEKYLEEHRELKRTMMNRAPNILKDDLPELKSFVERWMPLLCIMGIGGFDLRRYPWGQTCAVYRRIAEAKDGLYGPE